MWKLEDSLKEFDINTNIEFRKENCNPESIIIPIKYKSNFQE